MTEFEKRPGLLQVFTSVALAALTTACGCSTVSEPEYSKLGLVEVTGVATIESQPLAGVTLEFINESDLTYSYGYTDEGGRYSLMFDTRTAGIIPGPKAIRIRRGKPAGLSEAGPDGGGSDDPDEEGGQPASVGAASIPPCYTKVGALAVTIPDRDCRIDVKLAVECHAGKAIVVE